jgi:NitT/TauT family transport system permease protein
MALVAAERSSRAGFAGQALLVGGVAIILLLLWEFAVRWLKVPAYIIPAPSAVFEAFMRGLERGIYPPNAGATLLAMACGYALGAASGIVLGAVVAEFKVVERIVYPYVVSLQSLPKIALAPLFVMWFGYGVLSKVVMVTLICFFPLMVNTMTGLLSTERDRLDIVRTMTAGRWQLFWHVKLPSAAGHIFAGLQVAVVLSLIGALVGEFVGSDRGLGNLIQISQSSLDTAGMFAVLVILAATGMAATALVRFLHRRIVFWEAQERRAPAGGEQG